MTAPAKIVEYMLDHKGSRRRSLVIDGITVTVEPYENDGAARMLAEILSDVLPTLAELRAKVDALKAQVPPKAPARLMGPGCVRMRDGVVWLLGHRSKGWAAWGMRCDGWDDLFRRFNVIVTSHGTDEHGAWWQVENAKP